MYKNKKILALIPARGGSKGVFRKNIRKVAGKPLIAWTIEEAKKSVFIDRLIVTTDDKEIASVSKKYGADLPFMRPKRLATDKANVISAVMHALDWAEKHDEQYDIILLLQASSPLRKAEDMDNALKLLFSKKCESIVSVCESEHPPYWLNTLGRGGSMKDFIKKGLAGKNRQAFGAYYRISGALYLAYADYLKMKGSFLGKETYAYIMPAERSIDIDSEFDLQIADLLLRKRVS